MVIGWDIGGVNTKVALVEGGRLLATREAPFELQRAPGDLPALLRELAAALGARPGTPHVVTMTAELSQMFRTKRAGVAFVLDAVEAAFPGVVVRVFTVDGTFVDGAAARRAPLRVAASNWMATAQFVARTVRDALLIDLGTTTADIVPIREGQVLACGRTDPERLASGALVYCGAVRTPVEALLSHVPVRGVQTGVSAEGFALVGDAHVWLGVLSAGDYTGATPDGRPPTREYAGERLARVVCADREMLEDEAVSDIARAIAEAQLERLATAIARMTAGLAAGAPAVVTGRGASIAARAAGRAGLQGVSLQLGDEAAAQCAPAAAAAWLFEQGPDGRTPGLEARWWRPRRGTSVLKVGGGALRSAADLDVLVAQLETVGGASLLVVPGGGPFADSVREVNMRIGIADSAAHWMAILAMDQYAELLASRVPHAVLVRGPEDLDPVLGTGRLPVLAPSRWLRREDPLPHSWDVTSDSIAAWVAGRIGADRLILLKPRGATGDLTDPYFERARPAGLAVTALALERIAELPGLVAECSLIARSGDRSGEASARAELPHAR